MRETRKLTVRAIEALKPKGKPYKAADGEGLYIEEVTPRQGASCGASSTAMGARRSACHSAPGRMSPWKRPEP